MKQISLSHFKSIHLSLFTIVLISQISDHVCADTTTITQPASRTEWRNILNWDDNCEKGVKHIINADVGFIGVELTKLNSGDELVTVICKTGSYNQGRIVFIKAKGQPDFRIMKFPQIAILQNPPNPIGSKSSYYRYSDSFLWGNLKVDVDKNRVTNVNFFRGGGGCGISSEYKISGNHAEITSFKAHTPCNKTNLPIIKWHEFSKSEWSSWPIGDIPDR